MAIILQIYPGTSDFLNFTKSARISVLPAVFVMKPSSSSPSVPSSSSPPSATITTLESFTNANVNKGEEKGAAETIKTLLVAHSTKDVSTSGNVPEKPSSASQSQSQSQSQPQQQLLSSLQNSSSNSLSSGDTNECGVGGVGGGTPRNQPGSSSTSNPKPSGIEKSGTTKSVNKTNEAATTPTTTANPTKKTDEAKKGRSLSNDKPDNSSEDTEAKQQESARRYKEALKHKRQQEVDERKRILKLLETDKKERQARAKREAYKLSEKNGESGPSDEATVSHPNSKDQTANSSVQTGKNTTSKAKHCSLLVRTLDGSPLKHRFEATERLVDVRKWVDQELGTPSTIPSNTNNNNSQVNNSDSTTSTTTNTNSNDKASFNHENVELAYNFVNPLQRMTYGPGDEFNSTLADLGLVPSATLVIKMVANGSVAAAYGGTGFGGGGTGIMGSRGGPASAYGLVEKGVKGIVGAVSTFLGIGYVPDRVVEKQKEEANEQQIQREEQQRSYSRKDWKKKMGEDGGPVETKDVKEESGSGVDGDGEDDSLKASLLKKRGNAKGLTSGLSTRYSSAISFHDLINSSLQHQASTEGHNATSGGNSEGYHGLGKLGSAATSSSNVRTIYDTDNEDQDPRMTYNGNNLGLEDPPKKDKEDGNN